MSAQGIELNLLRESFIYSFGYLVNQRDGLILQQYVRQKSTPLWLLGD